MPRFSHRTKVVKNDRVFTCQRKRKNFEIFSTCSDAGDIEAADVGWREAGMARPQPAAGFESLSEVQHHREPRTAETPLRGCILRV